MPNIISDIAGNYKTLLALIKQMPDEEVISVGDMIDRGPRSKEVVEWFMKNGSAILGNHEHMMIDYKTKGHFYDEGIWLWNGGRATMRSYDHFIPGDVIEWMKSLPLYKEAEGCLISHSCIEDGLSLEESLELGINANDPANRRCIIWNRYKPKRREQWRLQIFGHNSQWGLRRFSDEQGEFAICLDACRQRVLTGIHLPSGQIYQQEYID
jgi:serine/threonine protein phosphatase 1